jgi:PEP-CTERM motif
MHPISDASVRPRRTSVAHVSPLGAGRLSLVAGAALLLIATSGYAQIKAEYAVFDGGPQWLGDDDGLPGMKGSTGPVGGSAPGATMTPSLGATAWVGISIKGVSQFDLRNILGGSFIPPDTMGAVGTTQFMEMTNGVYAIYNKSNGALQSMLDARTFWTNAGATGGLNGDARILFDKPSGRWIALQFGASVADIQIAVSSTSNALGAWQSTKFTGFAGGTADYPTLAVDAKAVYIGTNNFNASNNFAGTTLNVIARSDLLGPGAPTTASLKQFVTPYTGGASDVDRGFAIQGVNSSGRNTGMVMAASLFQNDSIRYTISNPGTAGATRSAVTFLGLDDYGSTSNARQPDGTRNIDPLDQRIGSSVWEQNGKVYAVYTATPVGGDHTEVRYVVTDAKTNAVIQQGSIGDPSYDFYEGSLTVNSSGQVVIGYNRSGYGADGRVSFFARTYDSDGSGKLVQTNELLLHVSDVGNYHNGSVEGAAAVGRQRWGDYSAVTLDPTDDQSFWAIGEYAAEWNNAAGGHPGGSGGSSWGTWISQVTLAVPEPETYALMFGGLLALAAYTRRRSAR